MYVICIGADLIELIITFVFLDLAGAGELIKWGINIFVWIILFFWLQGTKVRQTYIALGSLGEFIPIINSLPLRTVALWWTLKSK